MTTQITIAALLVHLGLGCCWHHAHWCTTSCEGAPVVAAEAETCDHHGHRQPHQHHAPRGQSDDKPCPSDHNPFEHGCDGQRCTFVQSEPTSAQKGESDRELCLVDWPLLAGETNQIRRANAVDFPARHHTSPLRAHLLLSVLLI